MFQRTRRLIVSLAIPAALVLSACGAITGGSDEEKAKLSSELLTELTERRGFTNAKIDGEVDAWHQKAKAIVSVGGCPIRLEWDRDRNWRMVKDDEVDDLPGELTAKQISDHPTYAHCTKETALPKPTS